MTLTLPGAPWLIAHRSMLGINQPYKLTLNGEDYVLWQSTDGQISALGNVCPHMQAPMSEGWVCEGRNTLACPFHGLEFDGEGRLVGQGAKPSARPMLDPLKIFVQGDFIWTYGNQTPAMEIPDLHESLTEEMQFVGVTGHTVLEVPFVQAVMVNYDFNHATATHRYPLQLEQSTVKDYEPNGHFTYVRQEIVRGRNSWRDVLREPALAVTPHRYENIFHYAFPSSTTLTTDLPSGQVVALFLLYPESETRTRTFALIYAKTPFKPLIPLLKRSILESYGLVIEQDADMLRKLYPPEKAKIRLPQEEVMYHAQRLFYSWPDEA